MFSFHLRSTGHWNSVKSATCSGVKPSFSILHHQFLSLRIGKAPAYTKSNDLAGILIQKRIELKENPGTGLQIADVQHHRWHGPVSSDDPACDCSVCGGFRPLRSVVKAFVRMTRNVVEALTAMIQHQPLLAVRTR